MNLSLDLSAFKRLSRKGNLVALSATVPADLETPVSAYLKLAAGQTHSFLLESAEQGEKIGRYSFIGIKPRAILSSQNGCVTVAEGKKIQKLRGVHLIDVIKKRLDACRLANPESLPEFSGGFVGYLSYENVVNFEQVKLTPRSGPKMPEGIFLLCEEFLIFDHFRKTLSAVIIQEIASPAKAPRLYAQAVKRIEAHLGALRKPFRLPKQGKAPSGRFVSNTTPKAFHQKVKKIKDYIRAGDCIQVVLSQRFKMPMPSQDFQIYRALRSINPSPYMFYLKSGKIRLIGSSPELLVRKTGRMAQVAPIAGTRPRGKTPAEDLQLEQNLKKSAKEMAEHLMLVDLGRNDLGRVCDFKSIEVRDFAHVERFSHVMHLVSEVRGRLKRGYDAFDLLKAAFPAGTVSGAPKIRAMEIIHELEPENRGPYAGSVGYFSFTQDMDMCIAIRTLFSDGRHLYLQAGAGIVKDSQPKKEYQETVNKAKALMNAVKIREKF